MLWTQLTCVWDTQLSTLLTLPVKTPGPHGPTIRTRRADFSLARSKQMEAYAAACSRRPAGWLPARGRGQQPFRTCVGDVLQHTLSPRRRGGSRSWVWRETPGRTRKSQGLQERGASELVSLKLQEPGCLGAPGLPTCASEPSTRPPPHHAFPHRVSQWGHTLEPLSGFDSWLHL